MQETVALPALIVAFLALAVSGYLAYRQASLMRLSNQLPLLIDLIRELRSTEFLERERFVNSELKGYDPGLGYADLPEEAADNLQHVKSLFDSIGALVAFKVIDERAAISIFGFRAKRAWASMQPFVEVERGKRAGNYGPYFEHFVCLIEETPPEKITKDLRLRRLPASVSKPREERRPVDLAQPNHAAARGRPDTPPPADF
ncbi:DUF4760 domain-containing protein [Pseudonocardia pini]|uniref:DUF4760 domain-containing protein n=1 Tax=Pseudonocardia pini TaxID=2758030 RepID=UPI0015F0EEB2|nr:hypothetical protein [Pseudonocardia pini]